MIFWNFINIPKNGKVIEKNSSLDAKITNLFRIRIKCHKSSGSEGMCIIIDTKKKSEYLVSNGENIVSE